MRLTTELLDVGILNGGSSEIFNYFNLGDSSSLFSFVPRCDADVIGSSVVVFAEGVSLSVCVWSPNGVAWNVSPRRPCHQLHVRDRQMSGRGLIATISH